MSKVKEERINRFDYMKAFLMFCVVLGHVTYWFPRNSYTLHCTQLWIYSFHMPAFIFLAGLFAKGIVNKRRWDRAFSYVVLYFFMKCLTFAVDTYRGSDTKIELLSADGFEWFALALFWWYAVTILIREIHPLYVMIVTVCLSMIFGYSEEIGSFLVLRRTLVFYPFFYLGYVMDANALIKRSLVHRKAKIAVSVFVLCSSYIFVWLNYSPDSFWLNLFRGRFSYSEIFGMENYLCGGMYRALSYMISFVMIFAVLTVLPDGRLKVFSYIGSRSLPVYVFHFSVMSLLFTLFKNFKAAMVEANLFLSSIVLSALLIAVTTLPVFESFLKRVMTIPRKPNSKAKRELP